MSQQDKHDYYQFMANQSGPHRAAFNMMSTLQQLGPQSTLEQQMVLQSMENQAERNGYGYNAAANQGSNGSGGGGRR